MTRIFEEWARGQTMTMSEHNISERAWHARDAELAEKDRRIAELEGEKNSAYQERDKLVCALSKLFPATLERHPAEDLSWDEDWRWIVFISLPNGQATWHIHDSELPMFTHLKQKTGAKWDGHSTPEKYERLAKIPSSVEHIASLESRIAAALALVNTMSGALAQELRAALKEKP